MTTFKLQYCTKGLSFWPRFAADKGGILLNRAKLREFKNSGVNWIGLTWMDSFWEDSYKTTKLSDPSHLISLIETCNQTYGLRTVLRLAFWKQTREQAYAGTLLRPMDGVILSAARVMKHVSPTMNAFQPVHEWGLVGDTFTQDALQAATTFVDGFYDRILPGIRGIAPSATVALSAPGWSKFHTGDHALMKPRPTENILRNIEYTTQAAQAKAWYAGRGEACIMTEGKEADVQAGLSAGIASAEWRDS